MSPILTRAASLVVLFTLPLSPAPAQGIHLWTDTQPGPVAAQNFGNAVATDGQGRVFAAGTVSNTANEDLRVVAYGPARQILWQHTLDLGGREYSADIALDEAADAVYVLGSHDPAPGPWEIWRIHRLTGAVVWHTSYSGPLATGGRAWNVSIDAAGGLVVGGSLSQFPSRASIAHFDANGVLGFEWSFASPGETNGYVVSTEPTSSGDILVRTREWGGPAAPLSIHRLTSAGVTLWSKVVNNGDQAFGGPVVDSATNSVYAVRVPMAGGNNLVKLDPAGAVVWSKSVDSILGVNNTVYFLRTDSNDEIVLLGSNNQVVRLDVNGNVLWNVHATPYSLEDGPVGGLRVDANGDAVVLLRGHAPNTFADFLTVARIDRNGQFNWSQGVRADAADTDVEAYDMQLLPHGGVALCGKTTAVGLSTSDMFVAAVREQSRKSCFGDGSSGACPCGNNVSVGLLTGCRRSPSVSAGARLEDTGIGSTGVDTLRFVADSAVNGPLMLLQGSPSAGATPFQDGLLCLGGPLLRLYTFTAASAVVDVPPPGALRVSAQSAFMGDVIAPGSARGYQVYLRSTVSFCQAGNGNFTNAIVVAWSP